MTTVGNGEGAVLRSGGRTSEPGMVPVDEGLPPHLRVFTNRNLRISSIEAIGFDMDHTLAVYNTDTFSRLSLELAVDLLVTKKGYPALIRDVKYDPQDAIRGLIVDKRLGNLLKVDAYNYVSRVRHGKNFLVRDERRKAYKRGRIRIGSERYRVFDTLFDLPEGCLYSSLVDLKDSRPELIRASYRVLFDDIRDAVDTIHRDGTLKRHIIADLDRFFHRDPRLGDTLQKFRQAGKRLFLLTNSEADYTAAVMNHLLTGVADGWEDYFDLVICSARKPEFFISQGGGKAIRRGSIAHLANRQGNCFSGGDAFFLESKIGAFGDAILYFGDHTYGDILRSKQSVGWRTAMIIPEVEGEILALQPLQEDVTDLAGLEEALENLVLERDHLQNHAGGNGDRLRRLNKAIGEALGRRGALQRRLAGAFSPHWGSHFKEGRAASRFGEQVGDFACIYSSRVSNFHRYPVDKFFAKPAEIMPHERWLGPGL